jgi:hypothetical protein
MQLTSVAFPIVTVQEIRIQISSQSRQQPEALNIGLGNTLFPVSFQYRKIEPITGRFNKRRPWRSMALIIADADNSWRR